MIIPFTVLRRVDSVLKPTKEDVLEIYNKYKDKLDNPDTQTKEQFKGPGYRLMVVANKFQTGFDQPLLHTMYVDKKLGGVNAVQTLSRLNRTHPQRKDTMVLDFDNEADDIKKAFDPYYEKTFISESTDKDVPYRLMEDLQDFNLYSDLNVDQFTEHYFQKKINQNKLYSILEPGKDRYKELGDDEQRDFYRKLRKYIHTYSFMSQILPYDDSELEKLYAFGKYLLRFISLKKESLPREVTQEVDMDSYRIQRMFEGKIEVESGKGKIETNQLDGEGQGTGEKEESLSEIIRILNER